VKTSASAVVSVEPDSSVAHPWFHAVDLFHHFSKPSKHVDMDVSLQGDFHEHEVHVGVLHEHVIQQQLHEACLHVVHVQACSHPTRDDDQLQVDAPHLFPPPLHEQVLMPVPQGHLQQPNVLVTSA